MEFSMMSPRVGGLVIGWSIDVLDTPPKTTIFGEQKVKADPMSHGEGNGLA